MMIPVRVFGGIQREGLMSEVEALVPPPAIIRERLSRNIREARLLRAILRRSSVLVAEERHRDKQSDGAGADAP